MILLFYLISSRNLTQQICLFHPLHYFLGMEVSRSTSGLRLTQTKSILLISYLVYPALRYASGCQAIRPYSYKRKEGRLP